MWSHLYPVHGNLGLGLLDLGHVQEEEERRGRSLPPSPRRRRGGRPCRRHWAGRHAANDWLWFSPSAESGRQTLNRLAAVTTTLTVNQNLSPLGFPSLPPSCSFWTPGTSESDNVTAKRCERRARKKNKISKPAYFVVYVLLCGHPSSL